MNETKKVNIGKSFIPGWTIYPRDGILFLRNALWITKTGNNYVEMQTELHWTALLVGTQQNVHPGKNVFGETEYSLCAVLQRDQNPAITYWNRKVESLSLN